MRPSWALSSMPGLRLTVLFLVGLISLPLIHALEASDYFVKSLPGAPDGPLLRMWAGHLETDPEHNGALFFWLYQHRNKTETQRTVIWLNGGPGCSSMDGALMEIGPYRVLQGGKLQYNEGSWSENANVLFVDNPVGTGFSYVQSDAYLHDLNQMADQFVVFLEKWFEIFPEYEKDELWFAGESYAGQHIPYIASAIVKRNADVTKRSWNLKGLLIGNGWISPADQYPAYSSFAYLKGLVETGSEESQRIEDAQLECYRKMRDLPGYPNGKGQVSIGECENILMTILKETLKPKNAKDKQCINMYDVRLRDEWSACGMNWPPDLKYVTPYLRNPQVIRALNIDPAKKAAGWSECNGQVSSSFNARNSIPSVKLLPDLLKHMPIMLFSGAEDLICNHLGTETLIENLEWNGGKGLKNAPAKTWMFEGEKAGTWQEARNLTYVLVLDSSHMVPFDLPRRSRDMLQRFLGMEVEPLVDPPMPNKTDNKVSNPPAGENVDYDPTPGSHKHAHSGSGANNSQGSKWDTYWRSGEVVLVIVVIAAGVWFWYVWRERRRRAGYGPLANGEAVGDGVLEGVKDVGRGAMRMEAFRHESSDRDLEAAEVDELPRPEKYEVGSDASDDDDDEHDHRTTPARGS